MNKRQLEYFRLKLLAWRTELLEDYNETRSHLEKGERAGSDFADMASAETNHAQELRTRDPQRSVRLTNNGSSRSDNVLSHKNQLTKKKEVGL